MRLSDIPEIATPEKMLLLEDLWDTIAQEETSIPVLQSQMDEPDRRRAEYQRNPENTLSLDELRAKMAQGISESSGDK